LDGLWRLLFAEFGFHGIVQNGQKRNANDAKNHRFEVVVDPWNRSQQITQRGDARYPKYRYCNAISDELFVCH
jgi:hypothetical protein